ncbi:MAG: ATP-binding protein [Desulfurococcales archaeon]|nr:ATP-binding protein [Desulfurococcales archaeon]
MLFSPQVKTRLEDFYNYREELNTLVNGVKDPLTRIIAVKGVRRIGKSSLLRVGLGLSGRPYILFDVRSMGDVTIDNVYRMLSAGLENALFRMKPLRSTLARVEGVEVAGLRVRIRDRRPSVLYEIFKALNEASPVEGFIIAIDEAQYLAVLRGFNRILAHIYDYMDRLKVVVAGSEVGLLDRLLGRRSPDAPLYGRPILEITMRRLPRSSSIGFLEQGFRELGMEWGRRHIEEAVGMLDGIPGWLTYYGYQAYTTGSHEEALARTIEVGSSIVARELESFLAVRQVARTRYLAILRCLKATPMTWSMLRRCMEAEVGARIANPQLYRYLRELQDYGIVEKEEGRYRISDPLLGEALARVR